MLKRSNRSKQCRKTNATPLLAGLIWVLCQIFQFDTIGPSLNKGGRTRSLIIFNSTHFLAGSVSGGIWRTTDGGSSWSPINDLFPYLAISTMAAAGNIVYAGTGEGYFRLSFLIKSIEVLIMPMEFVAWVSTKALIMASHGTYSPPQLSMTLPMYVKLLFCLEQAVTLCMLGRGKESTNLPYFLPPYSHSTL